MWIAPARMRAPRSRRSPNSGWTKYCAIFAGDYVGGRDLARCSARAGTSPRSTAATWSSSRRFEDEAVDSGRGDIDPSRRSSATSAVIDQWRKLPFRDPGLPREILPPDWGAPAAGALFEALVSALEPSALAHAAAHWPPTSKSTSPADPS